MKSKIIIDDFTKMEKYMINNFFHILLSPTRNPNIQIKEDKDKCYYDTEIRSNFQKDLQESLRFIENNCKNTIEIFNNPD